MTQTLPTPSDGALRSESLRHVYAQIIAASKIEQEVDLAYDGVQEPHYNLADALLAARPAPAATPAGGDVEVLRALSKKATPELWSVRSSNTDSGYVEIDGGSFDVRPNTKWHNLVRFCACHSGEPSVEGRANADLAVAAVNYVRTQVLTTPPASAAEGEDEFVLPWDVVFPGGRFSKGVALRTFINAALRWRAAAQEASDARPANTSASTADGEVPRLRECPAVATRDWSDRKAMVCVDPEGKPYWPSAQGTEVDSRWACFGACNDHRMDELTREGWRCLPVFVGDPAVPPTRVAGLDREVLTAILDKNVMTWGHEDSFENTLAAILDHQTPAPAGDAVEALKEALAEILEYRGGADSALDDEYVMERARAALAAITQGPSAGQAGWQPIASTPRDGTGVLLYAAAWDMPWGLQIGQFMDGEWLCGEGSVPDNDPGFNAEAAVEDDEELDFEANCGPTHWMPLPREPRSRYDSLPTAASEGAK